MKKVFLVLLCAAFLSVGLLSGIGLMNYEVTRPAYGQEKAKVYKVVVYNLFGRIVARFQGGVALWNKEELIKRLFIARFKPGTAVYIYRVYSPEGGYKQGKILVGENPDPGK